MTHRFGTPLAAAALLVVLALAATGIRTAQRQTEATAVINQGGAEVTAPPAGSSGIPVRIDDVTARSKVAAAPAAPRPPLDWPASASPQTMPSLLSPANAANDTLSNAQRVLPLSAAQRQALHTVIEQSAPALASEEQPEPATEVAVGTVLPGWVVMHPLPPEARAQLDNAGDFDWLRTGSQLLLVDPITWMVVAIL